MTNLSFFFSAAQKLIAFITVMITFWGAQAQQNATVILPGNYPDPSIVCVNNAYYLINSTGIDNPGIPVWHSPDLQTWNRIGYALNQKLGDVWAPDIIFYKGNWYIYFTAMVDGIGNFVVTAQKPEGPWSEPVRLDIRGIDPGHIATPDGKRYLYMSSGTMTELDSTGTRVIGEQRHVYNHWPVPEDYVIECVCTEGPKPVFQNNYYYLLVAQGGTSGPSTSHMVTAMRSENIDGPWEFSPFNPVIRTRDKSERWWSAGHGTLFQGAGEQWHIVFHAYENSYRNRGRQVLVTPVEWTEDGWFHEAPSTMFQDVIGENFTDEFDNDIPDFHWVFIDDSMKDRVKFENGKLVLHARGDGPASSNPMVITTEHHKYQVTTKVKVKNNVNAGLTLYYDNQAQWGISLSSKGITQIVNGEYHPQAKFDNEQLTAFLKVVNDRNDVSYFYSLDGDNWVQLERSHDISGFHTNTIGGYKSFRAGIFAAGSGDAAFDFFKYENLD